ncbi:MAG: histidine kinase [Chitinophagaceae bacterium]
MHRYPFIFSNERKLRFQRHFAFWSVWWIFQSLLYGYTPILMSLPIWTRFTISFTEGFFYLIPHMFMAYSFMYFVIPKLLVKGKYLFSALAVILIAIVTALCSALISIYILDDIRKYCMAEWPAVLERYTTASIWLSLLAGLRGALTIGGMAAAIKLMKHWYVKEQRNLQLQKENTESQLQLLKAQVHPHFLFNTLNNIYSHTQDIAPAASKLVMGLSDMLRYMLYECKQDAVPLSKELKMLQDYITLEKIRYGNQLDLNIELPKNANDLLIAPLLMLPFVENSFKHGSSHMIDQPWISLSITIDAHIMSMKLVNGKTGHSSHAAGGIGIGNARKRLDLLYPDRHVLNIQDEEDVFIINLKLELEKATVSKEKPLIQPIAAVYA